MLHIKYQGSRPSSFRVEYYENFVLCSYVQLMTPRVGLVLTPGAFYEQTWQRPTRRCHIPNIKSLCHPVSEKKNWRLASLFQCSNLWPRGRGQFWPQVHHMNKFGRGSLGDATYQISKLYVFQFQRRRILKFSFFVPMFQLVTPWAGPVLTPGASYEQTW